MFSKNAVSVAADGLFPFLTPLDRLAPYLRCGGGDGTRTHDRLVANQVLYQLSYAPRARPVRNVLSDRRSVRRSLSRRAMGEASRATRPLWNGRPRLVGLSGLEPLTSRLSGGRSNQLSYRPDWSSASRQPVFSCTDM